MPAAIPIIIAAVSAGVGATELGLSLSGAGQPSSNTSQEKQLLQQQQAQQAKADAAARQKAVFANLANAQDQSGGNLNSSGLVNLASIISGLPGDATSAQGSRALSQYLGTPQNTNSDQNLVSATYGLNGGQG